MTPSAENASAGSDRTRGTSRGQSRIERHHDDGASADFTIPDFVNDPQDLRQIAIVVIGALEKWEDVQGLGG